MFTLFKFLPTPQGMPLFRAGLFCAKGGALLPFGDALQVGLNIPSEGTQIEREIALCSQCGPCAKAARSVPVTRIHSQSRKPLQQWPLTQYNLHWNRYDGCGLALQTNCFYFRIKHSVVPTILILFDLFLPVIPAESSGHNPGLQHPN